jgi:DNA-binding response OmpR family regulator
VPAEHFAPPGAHGPGRSTIVAEELPVARTTSIRGKCVLLVEDEPLVALMMSQMIRDLGGEVLGPFGTLAETAGVDFSGVDAAVLDVNVAGELVYPLAERLAVAETPLVFLTGYDAKSIDSRFSGSNILTKPIDERELAAVLASLFEQAPPSAPAAPKGSRTLQTLM